MKIAPLAILLVLTSACSSMPRNKWTDKGMRIMIDPDSVSEEHYVQIQKSLVRSHKFTVVDRGRGLSAVKKEQERTHKEESDRFSDREKWSHWGKMYGVGSIIVAHAQCQKEFGTFNRTKMYLVCRQFLSMVDSNTGEVFLAVEGENEGPSTYELRYMVPNWDDVVSKLVDEYPNHFKTESYSSNVEDYMDLSKENAQRVQASK